MEAYFKENKMEVYINKAGESICKEERQFVIFLYLVFLKKKRGEIDSENREFINTTINKCLCLKETEKVDIIDVYFEATLMRDFWKYKKEEKKNFTAKILHYCLDFQIGIKKAEEVIESLSKGNNLYKNLGQVDWEDAIRKNYPDVKKLIEKGNVTDDDKQKVRIEVGLDIARKMMNVTPDILIIYKKDDKLYAKALECKYKSNEGRYKDVAGAGSKMQLFIQECVMGFWFGKKKVSVKNNHVPPHFPQSEKWRNSKELWKETCKKVYDGILEQEIETGEIINCGVQMVRFKEKCEGGRDKEKCEGGRDKEKCEGGRDKEKREGGRDKEKCEGGQENEIVISLKELLEKMY